MIRTLLLAVWLMFMLAPASLAVEKEKIKVACIGNSITFGAGLSNQARDSYPAVLGQMLGSGYDVRNFGVSGTTVLSSGDSPYINTRVYKQVFDFQPDIIFIKFGTNDSKGGNWKHTCSRVWILNLKFICVSRLHAILKKVRLKIAL